VVQISTGDGSAHLVQIDANTMQAPRLKAVLEDPGVLKIFHFARFDVATLLHHLGAETAPVYCTKIASRLTRTYTDRHGLKDLIKELLGIELNKQQQSSDWGSHVLSDAQKQYAAQDVIYLHEVRTRLDQMLQREGRTAIAKACFDFVATRAKLDLAGWAEEDIFAH
jgi:ribonuclease D